MKNSDVKKGDAIADLSGLSMQDLFRMEAENQTAVLTQSLLELEKNKHADVKLESLMRASHSIKGAARIVDIEPVVRLAHSMEDLFVAVQRNNLSLTAEDIDVLLRVIDTINQIAQVSEEDIKDYLEQREPDNKALIDAVRGILAGRDIAREQSTSPEKAARKPGEKAGKKTTRKKPKRNGSAEVPELGQPPADQPQGTDRVVRVAADQMDQLLWLSSELLVETRWLHPFSESLMQIKKKHSELTNILESLREALLDNRSISDHENLQMATAQKKLAECRNLLTEKMLDLDDFDRRNLNLSSRIYNQVVGSRMRPFSEAVHGLQRVARDLGRRLNKNVQLQIKGLDTPIDRDVVEHIKSPLNHLIRNAIDHGLESKEERQRLKKKTTGIVTVTAHHGGGMLTITIQDDGRGMDLDILREKIVQKGLITERLVKHLSEQELLEFLFLPDFSTKDSVTEISGRGVGLDVVHKMITDLHGSVNIESKPAVGTRFIMQLPVTLSILSTIMVTIAGDNYAFPLSRIDRLLTLAVTDLNVIEGRQYITVDGQHIGIAQASQILELDNVKQKSDEVNLVVISARDKRYGVVVDKFIGRRELSVQVLDSRLGKVQDISAAAITEDGEPVLIIDVDDLVRSIEIRINSGAAAHLVENEVVEIQSKRILVIDDSITVREVEKKLLVDNGYHVDVAIDGVDGWNAIRREKYDLLITDVDMPRMDGIELVERLKSDFHLKSMPVMIVSYKDRPEDRQRGLIAGADYYLTKGSFQDQTLIDAVIDLIGEARE